MVYAAFFQVKVSLVSAEAERICIDRMVKGQEKPFSNPEGLAEIDSRMASLVRGRRQLQQGHSLINFVPSLPFL